ncbi:DUF559 domain-containing protein [Pseudokineococcus basanitobsidens]|uniref:DUF559 domain-containing protein n=1 Tax=Pseudokineococcus basanitobsidens TaxID=1926649 RepID=A0ABU8RPA4_9ACTN
MPRRLPVPDDVVGVPLTTEQLLTRVTRGQLAGPAFRSVTRGVHVTAATPDDHGVRARAVLQAIRGPAALGGLSAAWAYGVHEAGDGDPVLVLAPRPAPRCREGVDVHQCALPREDVVRTRLGWVTTPRRTVVDLLRTLPMPRALVTAEAVAHRCGTRVEDVLAQVERQRGGRGLALARERVRRLEPEAESPRETALRLLLEDAGLPPCVVQHVVRDAGGAFVARLDLAWPGHRVAVEYDGDHHRGREQHSLDLARHNRLRALGWTVLQVDARVLAEPAELLRQLRSLLAA